MNYPKVTFMTASYNDKFMIELTINSILEQDYPNIEHIIMDAASTDGTIEMIKSYEKKYEEKDGANLIWYSKKDNGIYDAYNQIVDMATGDYLVICSDPLYSKDTTKNMIDEIISSNADGCIGKAIVVNSDMKVIRMVSGKLGDIRKGWIPAIPTMLLNKKVFNDYGKYDENFDTSTDYEFIIRIFKDNKLKIVSIDKPLIVFYAGGVSNGTFKGNLEGLKWGTKSLIKNNIKSPYFVNFLRIFRTLWQYRYMITRKKLDKDKGE